jgi:hypothetical protein
MLVCGRRLEALWVLSKPTSAGGAKVNLKLELLESQIIRYLIFYLYSEQRHKKESGNVVGTENR